MPIGEKITNNTMLSSSQAFIIGYLNDTEDNFDKQIEHLASKTITIMQLKSFIENCDPTYFKIKTGISQEDYLNNFK